jgi:peptidoglycan biosynthesis protein MviN/MurJ (putative lipid II flippase)
LNALATLLLLQRHVGLLEAAAAGVVAGGVFNFLFNIPSIWRTWGRQPSRS